MLEWFETVAIGTPWQTSARAANEQAIASLRRRGYVENPNAPWMLLNGRSLDEIEEPRVPDGYRLTTMHETLDIAARVAVHRDAFQPSRVTEESYRNVTRTWPYRRELDCVVQAPDNSLAAYALVWLDDENGVGEVEPVGTRSDHRRRGLARAVSLFALQRMRASGAEHAVVACRGDESYPIPKLLYESVGFHELSRSIPFGNG